MSIKAKKALFVLIDDNGTASDADQVIISSGNVRPVADSQQAQDVMPVSH